MNKEFIKGIPILEILLANGFEAYFVGGSVRDSLMDRPIHDVDIATSATPQDVKKLFDHTIDVGIDHGTILVLYKGESYEVTTFRTEDTYRDYRRPDQVTFVKTLHEDLKRRDFTINAMAMDKDGQIHDPFGGLQDIQAKIIRTVGSAEERFQEDALRMLRGVRFVSQLGFSLDEETKVALADKSSLLKYIAQERKTAEFEKMLMGKNPVEALAIAVNTHLLDYFPGLNNITRNFDGFSTLSLSYCVDFEEWLATICIFENKNQTLLSQWKLPGIIFKKVKILLTGYEIRSSQELSKMHVFNWGLGNTKSIERVWAVMSGKKPDFNKIDTLYESMPIHNESELQITGHDLMKWSDTKGGPWIKEWIKDIIQAILDGEIANEKELIKEWLIRKNKI